MGTHVHVPITPFVGSPLPKERPTHSSPSIPDLQGGQGHRRYQKKANLIIFLKFNLYMSAASSRHIATQAPCLTLKMDLGTQNYRIECA